MSGIYFDNPAIARLIGVMALNFILFSGGLDTHWESIRPVVWLGIALSTLGVFITAFLVGIVVHYVLNFTLLEGLLSGSIVSCTDAAAVFSILRNKGIGLKGSLRPVLELERGSNDPMAYFLTITLTALVANGDLTMKTLIVALIKEFGLGAVMGLAMGRVSEWLINRVKLDFDGLYPVLILGLLLFTYSMTHFIGGNGFLAVYLSAVVLGNSSFIHKRTMIRFYEGQAWLMQIILFLTLGLLVFPFQILPVAGYGLLISAFLILIARPISVFISMAFFKINLRSKLFLSWVGLRGAVPIVFATYPMIAGLEKSNMIFNLVFFISVTSVLLQGTTLSIVAKLLGVALPPAVRRKDVRGFDDNDNVRGEMRQIVVPENSPAVSKCIVNLKIPYSVHIMALKRGEHYIQPIGSTKVMAGDTLFMLADDDKALQTVIDTLNFNLRP